MRRQEDPPKAKGLKQSYLAALFTYKLFFRIEM